MKFKSIVLACLAFVISSWSLAQADCPTVSSTLPAAEDAFVRALDPTLNYGGAGALCASGPDALNSLGQPTGRSETVIKFNTAAAVTAFDTAFGTGLWKLSSARLDLTEVAFPNNTIFSLGLGMFDIRWLSDDNWVQGTGRPLFPLVGTGLEMTWNLLQTILSSATEANLGQFSNTLTSALVSCNLNLASPFVSDVKTGGSLTLHILPATNGLGFVYNSSNYIVPSNAPQLTLSAQSARGDLNCDDLINLDDVTPFVTALLDPTGYAAQFPGCNILRADLNADGSTNGIDVSGFVAALFPCP